MGIGTKFLSESILLEEEAMGQAGRGRNRYGRRVRDCHAEVLARRAFRRYLTIEIKNDLQSYYNEKQRQKQHQMDYENSVGKYQYNGQTNDQNNEYPSILQRNKPIDNGGIVYELKSSITLRMYASSAPCGNSTVCKIGETILISILGF